MLSDASLWSDSHRLVIKVPLGFTDRASMLVKSGIGFQAGVTLHCPNGLDSSLGIGQESKHRYIHPETLLETADFGWAASPWVDRGGSLLASLLVDPNTERFIALNVFPGILPVVPWAGLWLTIDGRGRPSFGLTAQRALGVGAGIGI